MDIIESDPNIQLKNILLESNGIYINHITDVHTAFITSRDAQRKQNVENLLLYRYKYTNPIINNIINMYIKFEQTNQIKNIIIEEIVLYAIKLDYKLIIKLDNMFKTNEVINFCLNENGYFLECVPNSLKTKEHVKLAIKNKNKSHAYHVVSITNFIPHHLYDIEISKLLLEISPDYLKDIPDKIIGQFDFEYISDVIKRSPKSIQFIPDDLISYDIMEIAIKYDYNTLIILNKYIDKELIMIAFSNHSNITYDDVKNILNIIPKHIIDVDIATLLIKIAGFSVEYIPNNIIRKLDIEKIIENNPLVLVSLKEKNIISKKIIKIAFDNIYKLTDEDTKKFIDMIANYDYLLSLINKNFASVIVSYNHKYINNIPKKFITYEMIKMVVDNDPSNIAPVNIKYITEKMSKDIFIKLLQKDCNIIKFIPLNVIYQFHDDFFRIILNENGLLLIRCPEHLITEELCTIAIQNNHDAIKFVPTKFKDTFKKQIIYEKTDNECLFTMIQIEPNTEYYRCSNKLNHVMSKEIFDSWILLDYKKNNVCLYCKKIINLLKIYVNA